MFWSDIITYMKALGFITLLIVAAVIAYMAFNSTGFGIGGGNNQVKTGQGAVDHANKAAEQQRQQYESVGEEAELQSQINGQPSIKYQTNQDIGE